MKVNKNINVEPLFKNYKKTLHLSIDAKTQKLYLFLNIIMQV
jgi:hypothetical protein